MPDTPDPAPDLTGTTPPPAGSSDPSAQAARELFEMVADATLPVSPPASRPGSSQPRDTVPDLPLPEELTALLPHGMYKVEGFLGQGGMGAVYKGTHVRLKRPVAIKIMHREAGRDYDFAQRFEREAQAMARLSHPNIVGVFDYGEAGPDYLYIVMELVDGADLMDVIRTGRMTQEMALTLLPQICDALQFAHDHSIVHRDIKPSNIMLTRDGRVKMCDFGLAKRYDVESSFRTQTGTGMGTPDYAAPEQFKEGAPIDHRADIYALGVMIYQMITGELPRGVWKPPSQRAPVVPEWDDIVAHAMQSDPADRYQKASEIKTDVSKITPAESRRSRQTTDSGSRLSRQTEGASPQPRALASAPTTPATVSLSPSPQASPSSITTATKDAPYTNSLGMKFVPVPGTQVLFSIWPTRVQDYAEFAKAQEVAGKKVDGGWNSQQKDGVPTGRELDHPVVSVNWDDAQAFCQWLTAKETTEGKLPKGAKYRLPTDAEWSTAVGLPPEDGSTPEEKNGKNDVDFPWGNEWPPKGKVGNYADESFHGKFPVKPNAQTNKDENLWMQGYTDGYATTAPVGNFPANAYGLHDMGGNVWQWCEDWFNKSQAARVMRGASWNSHVRNSLRSSNRYDSVATARSSNYGFRCVLEPASSTATVSLSPNLPVSKSSVATATKDAPFINTLGMKFVPVPITGGPTDGKRVLFSVWETRERDYEAFVKETGREWQKDALIDRGPEHPATNLRWVDATDFCTWLTERERTSGALGAHDTYRLPTDHEWSCAVGIGMREDATKSPREKDDQLNDVFLWNGPWPPPEKSGNYWSEELRALIATGRLTHIKTEGDLPGYRDGFATTAPVGSFPANELGLHDLGGNVWEACADWYDDKKEFRVQRGASWGVHARGHLAAGNRITLHPDRPGRSPEVGFRCILESAPPDKPVVVVTAASKAISERAVGKWIDALGNIESRSGGVTSKLGAWKMEDGRLVAQMHGYTRLCGQAFRNAAVRVRFLPAVNNPNCTIFPRARELPDPKFYMAVLPNSENGYMAFVDSGTTPRTEKLLGSFANPVVKANEEITLEARAVGEIFTVLVNDKIVLEATDVSWLEAGYLMIDCSAGTSFSKIEYQELPDHAATISPSPNLPASSSSSVATATKATPFINTLGMKFVPVPITGGPTDGQRVLFSVWETRVQDYEVFVKEKRRAWKKPDHPQEPTHPAVMVSWDDAVTFCAWLTEHERSLGKLGFGHVYRLPSDHEWSCAIGIGGMENPAQSPAEKGGKISKLYPWGTDWPPPSGVGNYAGEEMREPLSAKKYPWITGVIPGLRDASVETSPVGSFEPSKDGLHDLSGNAWEWCADMIDDAHNHRVMRGGSWEQSQSAVLLSSARGQYMPTNPILSFGFRVVLATVRD